MKSAFVASGAAGCGNGVLGELYLLVLVSYTAKTTALSASLQVRDKGREDSRSFSVEINK